MTGPDASHIGLEDLALLAEGRLKPEQAARLHEHLAECRQCTAAYADAVRYRAVWLAESEAFVPPRELIGAGVAVGPGEPEPLREPRRVSARGALSRGVRRGWVLAGASLALAGLVAAPVLFGNRSDARLLPPDIR